MDQPQPRRSRASTQRSDRLRPARDGDCRGDDPDAQHLVPAGLGELRKRILCIVDSVRSAFSDDSAQLPSEGTVVHDR